MTAVLGPVPADCRRRLISHYGDQASAWLDVAPHVLMDAARQWDLNPNGYHDTGHASVLASARTSTGDDVLLKAWYEQDRHRFETNALIHWRHINGDVVRNRDARLAVACLNLVGRVAGGAPRPLDEELLTAQALARLHQIPLAPGATYPSLDHHLRHTLVPRVRRRTSVLADVPATCIDAGVAAAETSLSRAAALLHGDLYRENVLFDIAGTPVFIDPLPMVGDPCYDWAFFVVYYALHANPLARLDLAVDVSGLPARLIASWCMLHCLDGLAYYRETGDERARRMRDVLAQLAAVGAVRC
jgi:streptomycin 6-kinase